MRSGYEVVKNNYREEILKIIDTWGGRFTGFNKLQKIGNFHSTSLQNHLLEMEKQNLITITKFKDGKTRTQYCRITPHYGLQLKLDDRIIEKIRRLREKALTYEESLILGGSIVRIAFNKYKNIILGELSSKFIDYPVDPHKLKDGKKHYWFIIMDELEKFRETDRRRIINSLWEDEPDKWILKSIENRRNSKKLPSSA